MTVLLAASSAVTVNVNATPAVVVAGAAVTEKCVAAPATTVIDPDTPVMLGVSVSVAVTVCTPAICRVAGKALLPASPAVNV